jgi:hypothetical protein
MDTEIQKSAAPDWEHMPVAEFIARRSRKLASENKQRSDILSSKYAGVTKTAFVKNRKKVFVPIYAIIAIAFLIMAGIVVLRGDKDQNVFIGLFVTSAILSLINFALVAFESRWALLFFSAAQFIINIAMLARAETIGIVDCTANSTMYKVYMASHTFNVVLMFFAIISAILVDDAKPGIGTAMQVIKNY